MIGSLIDTAILAGGDEDSLNQLASTYFNEIQRITNPAPLRKWLKGVVKEIVDIVSNVYESRSKVLIDKARTIIEEQFSSSKLSYKDVAREIFISPSYFLNLFKQETGETFVDYLKNLRIERAKELLLNSNKSIAQIALDIGFSNPNYFSSQFTKSVGVTAKEYRKKWERKR